MLLLSGNPVKVLDNEAFSGIGRISNLDLSYLDIEDIHSRAFNGLTQVTYIDLSHNNIQVLLQQVLLHVQNAKHLILNGDPFEFAGYSDLPLMGHMTYMAADDWRFCCLAKSVTTCDTPNKMLASCRHILGSTGLKIIIWLTGFASFSSNIFVIAYHSVTSGFQLNSHKIILVNLAISDMLMSFYLLGLGVADVWYHNRYILSADKWISSPLCQTLGVLSSLSSEMSLFNVVLLSGFYYIASRSPLKHTSTKTTICTCLASWVIFGSACGLHVLGEMTSGTCLFLNLGSSAHKGWQFNIALYMVTNTVLIIVSMVFSVLLVRLTYASSKHVEMSGNVTSSHRTLQLGKNLLIFVLLNLSCWIPIEVSLMMSVCGVQIDSQVIGWFTILVVPLNSITNPFTYTIKAIVAKKAK